MEFKSEEEKQYYEFLLKTLKDGIIDDSERKLLNKQKEKYHISDERALELEKIVKYIFLGVEKNEIEYYEVLLDSLEDDNIIDSSERDILNDIKKENNISDERALELEKLANSNVNKNSKEIINEITNIEVKSVKEENNDSKKVIENEEDDIEEFDAEVVSYKKRKKKRGNVSMLDKVEYYAKTKRPIWLKLWIWFVILGLEIYFAYSLKDVNETDSILGKIFSFISSNVFSILNEVSQGALQQLSGIVNIVIYVMILFVLYIIFHILLTYLPSFISVMSNMGKKEIKKDLHLGTIFISIALIVFSFLFVRDNNKELNELRKNVNNALKNEQYLQAFEYIQNTESGALSDKINNDVRFYEYKKVLDAITNKLNSMNLENIYQSDEDYKYINDTLKGVYNSTINKVPQHRKSYDDVINELTKKTFEKYIQGFIVNGQYMEAYNIINNIKDNLEFKGGKKILWFIPTDKEINEVKNDEFQKLASSIYSSFVSKSREEMNKENYDFINKEILAVYDGLDKKYKESYKDDIGSYKQRIDISRDEYLTMLMGQISNMSPNEAKLKLNEVYHNSDGEKSRKTFGIGNIDTGIQIPNLKIVDPGKESYKNYWEKLKNEYLKEINKN